MSLANGSAKSKVRLASNRRARLAGDRSLTVALLLLLLALCGTPLFLLFKLVFQDSARGLRTMMAAPGLDDVLRNTVLLAFGSVLIAVTMGTVLAWCAHRLPQRSRWMAAIPIIPLMIPPVASVTGFAFLFSPKVGYANSALRMLPMFDHLEQGPVDVYSMPWIVLITGFSMTSLMFLLVRGSLAQLPQELIDAAAVSGLSRSRRFVKVVVPLLRPTLVNGSITMLLIGLGQFTAPLLLGTQTGIKVLSTEMYLRTLDFPADYATASAFGLPILLIGLLLLFAQRVAIGDQRRFAMASTRGERSLETSGLTAKCALIGFGAFTAVLPIGALLLVALSPFWSATIDLSTLTLANFQDVLDTPALMHAVKNTLAYSVIATLVALVIGYAAARVIFGRERRPVLASLIEGATSLPLGIPHVIFGAGFLFAFTTAPLRDLGFYGTPTAMIIVFVTLMVPHATRFQYVAMMNLGEELGNAASASGAGWFRRTLLIDLPLLRQAVISAAIFMVVLLTHEFTAALLMRTSNTEVLGTVLYDEWTGGSYPKVAVISIGMVFITFVGVAIVAVLGGKSVAMKGFSDRSV